MENKSFNKNILVFVLCFAILISGLCSKLLISSLSIGILDFLKGNSSVETATDEIDSASTKYLSYHNLLLDINSIKENLLGTRIITKDEDVIAKTDSGSLIYTGTNKLSDEEISKVLSNILKIQEVTKSTGAKFLYCAVPGEEYYRTTPVNATDFTKDNYNNFISQMKNSGVPLLDFSPILSEKYGINNIYYYTDHHWKTNVGFDATGYICEQLNLLYNFEYNTEYTNIDNYKSTTYSNIFLGSQGKKTGTFFTWQGTDDFELITPNFETDLIVSEPMKDLVRTGSFEDTILYKEYLKKDCYNISSYSVYGGGDKRLQIITNQMNPEGKTILVIRDSFASVVTPFLSLQTAELHICDIRDFENNTYEAIDVVKYIEEIKPDYVIALFSNTSFPEIK